jgi:hypothetical protein
VPAHPTRLRACPLHHVATQPLPSFFLLFFQRQAIVDDISCVILHTSGLPPPERGASLPRPLARAASCNDEANELYLQWRQERECNPSNHKPQQYFSHLYGEEREGGGGGGEQQERTAAAGAAGDGAEAPSPPVSPNQRDAPQYGRPLQRADSSGASSSAAAAALAAVAAAPTLLPSPPHAPPLPPSPLKPQRVRSSAEVLHRMDDFSTASPHSSCGDLRSETSEPSTRR